jgi:hypothetical protein
LVKDNFVEHWTIPTAESVVFSWLSDKGWKPQLSAPGILAKQIYRSLEGFPAILKDEKLLWLFEHMNGGSVGRDGSPTEDEKLVRERDLPVGEVKSRLGAIGRGGNPYSYSYLTTRGIFKLGARIQCPRCLRHSWFPLDSIRDAFTCPKCLNVFPAIGNLENATWSHKTTGPFSVPQYADGAYAVLLTLELFSDRHMTTMRTTPVLSFAAEAPNKEKIEADFAFFWQQSLYGEQKDGILFGECKTYGRFEEKDFARMRRLAALFPGSVLVFSTLRKSLTEAEIKGITRIAKTGRKYWKPERPINPVTVLTGTELLALSEPPYCWESPLREKYRGVHDILALADATQQIYLRLPSWQTEWHEKWERKRQQRIRAASPRSEP